MCAPRRTVVVCLVGLALVLAGCQAPTAESAGGEKESGSGPGGTNASAPPEIAVENGSLTLNPGQTFVRVQNVTGTDVPPPERIRAFGTAEAFRNSTGGLGTGDVPRFWQLAGLRTGEVDRSELEIHKNGYVTPGGAVAVYVDENASLADERLVLAHELVHYVQTQNERRAEIRGSVGIGTTESDLLLGAVLEGGAVYATDEYMRRYGAGNRSNSAWYPEIQRSYPEGHVGRLLNSRYIAGAAYVAERLDSPRELPAVYANPPRTTEQLLHGLEPGAEPPTPLSVEPRSEGTWRPSGTDRLGELFVRYALESGVGPERAQRAAAGWGNDTVTFFREAASDETGYVWVLDWDSPDEDDEFRAALTDALDERGAPAEGTWKLRNGTVTAGVVDVRAETTALVLGPERFVRGTTLTANGTRVTVTVEAGAQTGGSTSE